VAVCTNDVSSQPSIKPKEEEAAVVVEVASGTEQGKLRVLQVNIFSWVVS